MSKIKWIIFCILTVGGFAALVIYSQNTKTNTQDVDVNAVQTASEQNGNIADHVYGNTSSKVILINYGDFQCPSCGTAHPQIKSIVEEYKDKIQFVFRNYTLPYHTNAKAASGTAEAAGLQNKYWEMHDKIYENQADWEDLNGNERDDKFVSYAKELNLNIDKFKIDIASDRVAKKISDDLMIGNKAKVTGTPAFFLNGKALAGETWGDEAKLKAALDEAITKNQ